MITAVLNPYRQPAGEDRPLTVSQLIEAVNAQVKDLGKLRVIGEVSRIDERNGHRYFVIKEGSNFAFNAILWRSRRPIALPQEGQSFVFTGSLDLYQNGKLSMVVDQIEFDDVGKLRQQLEELRRRLEQEGAFAPERKRPIPLLPKAVAVITSQAGAAIEDFCQTVHHRYPNMDIYVYPALVQGQASAASVIAALEQANRERLADVVVITRGGGSFEDLFAFNTEPVVRAILESELPVVTAIGHSTDRCLSDLVADFECRTPTEAANRVVPEKASELERLRLLSQRIAGRLQIDHRNRQIQLEGLARRVELCAPQRLVEGHLEKLAERGLRLQQGLQRMLRERQAQMEGMRVPARVARALQMRVERSEQELARRDQELGRAFERGLEGRQQRLQALAGRMAAIDPEAVLQRGYAIVSDESGQELRSADKVTKGQKVRIRLQRGRMTAKIEEVEL